MPDNDRAQSTLKYFILAIATAVFANMGLLGPAFAPELIETPTKEDMTTQYLFDDLKADEGLRLKAYRDSKGIWTIGIGHNIQVDKEMMPKLAQLQKTGITLEQARAIFEKDLEIAKGDLDRLIPWWRNLDDTRQDALLNMCFNMGCTKFVFGWPNFLNDVKGGHWASAARRIRTSKYRNDVGDRAFRVAHQIELGVRNRAATK